MTDLIKQITNDLQQQIDTFKPKMDLADVGSVIDAGDGIARVRGLDEVRAQELVQFDNGINACGLRCCFFGRHRGNANRHGLGKKPNDLQENNVIRGG